MTKKLTLNTLQGTNTVHGAVTRIQTRNIACRRTSQYTPDEVYIYIYGRARPESDLFRSDAGFAA